MGQLGDRRRVGRSGRPWNMRAAALGSCGNEMTIVMYSSVQEALYQPHYIYAHGEIMSAHGVLTSVQIMDHGMENKWSD